MVLSCCAYGCKQYWVTGGGVTFHSFPKDERKRKLWAIQLRRENFKITDCTKICSKHFTPDSFDREKLGGTWLKKDAVPTLFDFSDQPNSNERSKRRSIQVVIPPLDDPGSSGDSRVENSSVSTTPLNRKHYLGDFDEEDMKYPDRARQMLTLAKEIVRSKARAIKTLKRACSRYEDQIASLTGKLRRANKRLGRPKKKRRSEETTSFNHDVSANLELELTTAESVSDHEIAIKEEPMWEEEESGTSGYQDVYPGLASTDPASCPGVSSTTVTPSVVSVTSLAKPLPPPTGEILGMPVGELPAILGSPLPQNVPEDNSGATNGLLEKKLSSSSSSEAAGEETKVLPECRMRDQFDVYGEYIASKLRRLDWRTCAHVQKAFGDIIFQAELGKFTVPCLEYPTP